MKWVNTLSIYTEGNFFYGHYPGIERFNIIMLDVIGNSNPFVDGLNVILIPVSLYIHTKLNSMLVNDQIPTELSANSFYKKYPAKFYGIDPTAETVSEHVEGTISKTHVTLAEALAILNLLLQNETGSVIYTYFLCDMAGEAERLGLAKDVLALIPFDGKGIENGPTGEMPKGFWDWLVSIFVAIVTFIVGIIVAIVNFLVQLVTVLIDWGMKLIGALIAAFMAFIEAAIKLIILVFIYIMLAITLLFIIISFSILLIFLLGLTNSHPEVLTYGFLWYELKSPTSNGRFEVTITQEHSSLFDLTFPCLKISSFRSNKTVFSLIFSFGIPTDTKAITTLENNSMNSENQSRSATEVSSMDNYDFSPDFAYNLGEIYAFAFGLIFVIIISMTVGFTPAMLALVGMLAVIAWFFIKIWTEPSPEIKRALIAGYGFGLFQIGLAMLSPLSPGATLTDFVIWNLVYFLIPVILKELLFHEYPQDSILALIYYGFGWLATILWNYNIEKNPWDRAPAWILLGAFYLGIGIFFCVSVLIIPWLFGI